MAFDLGLWSEGAAPLLLVCEEAHRYASADRNIGFGPTRRSISRIAKEGRKHGVFLGLVSQRPAELDATITSQCSTLFAMRMINDRDQSILRSAVSDAAANLLDFLPSLGTAEVFAFGEGVAMPTRIKLKQLPAHQLPKSDAVSNTRGDAGLNEEFIATVLKRWRGDTTGVNLDDGTRDPRIQDAKSFDAKSFDAKSFDTKPFDAKSFDTKPFEQNAMPPLQPEQPAEPPRFGTLKRQLSDRLDVSRAFQAPAKPNR
jgi:hypothetical protein